MEHMERKFNKSRNRDKEAVRLDGQEKLKKESFWYLWSIIHKDEEIEEDVNHKIRAWWMKWKKHISSIE